MSSIIIKTYSELVDLKKFLMKRGGVAKQVATEISTMLNVLNKNDFNRLQFVYVPNDGFFSLENAISKGYHNFDPIESLIPKIITPTRLELIMAKKTVDHKPFSILIDKYLMGNLDASDNDKIDVLVRDFDNVPNEIINLLPSGFNPIKTIDTDHEFIVIKLN